MLENLFSTDRNFPVPIDPVGGYYQRGTNEPGGPKILSFFQQRILFDPSDRVLLDNISKYQSDPTSPVQIEAEITYPEKQDYIILNGKINFNINLDEIECIFTIDNLFSYGFISSPNDQGLIPLDRHPFLNKLVDFVPNHETIKLEELYRNRWYAYPLLITVDQLTGGFVFDTLQKDNIFLVLFKDQTIVICTNISTFDYTGKNSRGLHLVYSINDPHIFFWSNPTFESSGYTYPYYIQGVYITIAQTKRASTSNIFSINIETLKPLRFSRNRTFEIWCKQKTIEDDDYYRRYKRTTKSFLLYGHSTNIVPLIRILSTPASSRSIIIQKEKELEKEQTRLVSIFRCTGQLTIDARYCPILPKSITGYAHGPVLSKYEGEYYYITKETTITSFIGGYSGNSTDEKIANFLSSNFKKLITFNEDIGDSISGFYIYKEPYTLIYCNGEQTGLIIHNPIFICSREMSRWQYTYLFLSPYINASYYVPIPVRTYKSVLRKETDIDTSQYLISSVGLINRKFRSNVTICHSLTFVEHTIVRNLIRNEQRYSYNIIPYIAIKNAEQKEVTQYGRLSGYIFKNQFFFHVSYTTSGMTYFVVFPLGKPVNYGFTEFTIERDNIIDKYTSFLNLYLYSFSNNYDIPSENEIATLMNEKIPPQTIMNWLYTPNLIKDEYSNKGGLLNLPDYGAQILETIFNRQIALPYAFVISERFNYYIIVDTTKTEIWSREITTIENIKVKIRQIRKWAVQRIYKITQYITSYIQYEKDVIYTRRIHNTDLLSSNEVKILGENVQDENIIQTILNDIFIHRHYIYASIPLEKSRYMSSMSILKHPEREGCSYDYRVELIDEIVTTQQSTQFDTSEWTKEEDSIYTTGSIFMSNILRMFDGYIIVENAETFQIDFTMPFNYPRHLLTLIFDNRRSYSIPPNAPKTCREAFNLPNKINVPLNSTFTFGRVYDTLRIRFTIVRDNQTEYIDKTYPYEYYCSIRPLQ